MSKVKMMNGLYGMSIQINNQKYSLLPRTRWYEFLLPFNMLYLGHELGPYRPTKPIPKNNSNYYFTGYGLSGIITAFLGSKIVLLDLPIMNFYKMTLYFFGISLAVIWWHLRKNKWLRLTGLKSTTLPTIYLYPKFKTSIFIILGSLFNLAITYFMLFNNLSSTMEDLQIFVGLPLFGAFMGLIGVFSMIPSKKYYSVKKIKYQGQEISTSELEQIFKNSISSH